MKALWVHSTRFLEKDGRVFSEGAMSHGIWQRYLRHFSSLTVAGRGPETDTTLHKKYVQQSSGADVQFELLPSLNSGFDLLKNRNPVNARLRRLILDADGIIARLPSEHGLAAIELAHAYKKPYAIELVGCAWDAMWNHGDIRGKLYAPLLAWRVRRAARRAPFVLYVTREFLQRRYPARNHATHVSNAEIPASIVTAISDVEIPNPFASSVHSPPFPRFDQLSGTREGTFVVGLSGTFQAAYKGHETALKALAKVVRSNDRILLRLIGTGDFFHWQRMSKNLGVEKFVSFEGLLPPGNAIFEWLKGLDLYLQPSLTEGLPRALIEAMACARPSLASTTGGIPELLEPECLHRPGDWQRLAAQILRAMHDPDWRSTQARRNLETARNYEAPLLNSKRDEFWSSFAKHCYTRNPMIDTH